MKTKQATCNKLNKETVSDFTATVITDIEKLEEIRNDWEGEKFFSLIPYYYYLTIIKSSKNSTRPLVVVISKNGTPEMIVAGKIENIKSKNKLTTKFLNFLDIRVLTIVEYGVGGCASFECSLLAIKTLLECLKKREADLVSFREIRLDSDIYRQGRRIAGLLYRDYLPSKLKHFLLRKTKEFNKLINRKRRKELRRNWKKLKEQFRDNVEIKYYSKKEELANCCKDIEKISNNSKHHSFNNSINSRENLECVATQGDLKAFILYLGGIPCAYYSGFVKKDIFIYISTGYDRDYREFRVGAVLMWHTLEYLWADDRIKAIDFGNGDYLYKQNICDTYWDEVDFYIFQPSLRGAVLNIAGTIFRIVYKIKNLFLK